MKVVCSPARPSKLTQSKLTFSTAKTLLAFVIVASACASLAQTIPPPGLQIGSANTATADPPVTRPATTPCVVPLFTNFTFADFSLHAFSFTPPADCPGPWAKVVLNADFSIQAGRQFDRTASIWIGGTNVYFGTTSEPSRTVARSWHIERDLTDYSPLFKTAQNGKVDLGNVVNSTFTSSLFGAAELQFYPLAHRQNAPRTADVVLPLSSDATGGTVFLSSTSSLLSGTFTMPANVERAFIDVFAQSQSGDEFWYICAPDDVAAELQDCGSTGFREAQVTIDGQPAGVAPVYPWIYTGGIDVLLWRPIPGVQTLNFVPYRVNLTPFAGVLSNGVPHQVSVSVFNATSGFSTTATLLLYLDHDSTHVTGEVTRNTLTAAPTPTIVENLTNTNGDVTGNVTVTSSRHFTVEGFVRTSHGRVETEVEQDIHFSNSQDYIINNSLFSLILAQNTTISSMTETESHGEHETEFQKFEWPLALSFVFSVNPDGSGSQATNIKQAYNNSTMVRGDGRDRDDGLIFFSTVSNSVSPSDTQVFNASGVVTAIQNQANTQTYLSRDSTGACFSRTIAAAGGVLTSITDGVGCKRDHDEDGDRDRDDR